jgi:hypothetical protein
MMKAMVSPDDDSDSNKKQRTRPIAATAANKKSRCDPSQAILNIEKLEDETLCITMAEGWEDVLPQTFEDDPGSLVM